MAPGRRSASIDGWGLSLHLILGLAILGTLQGGLASPSFRSQSPHIPRADMERFLVGEDGAGDELILKPGAMYNPEGFNSQWAPSSHPYFLRRIRNPSSMIPTAGDGTDGGEDQIQRFCSNRLREALDQVCNGSFHNPIASMGTIRKRSSSSVRDMPRNVVEECCRKPCRKQDLRKYCGGGGQGSSSTLAQNPRSDEFPSAAQIATVDARPESEKSLLRSLILTVFNHVFTRNNTKLRGSPSSPSNQGVSQRRIQDRSGYYPGSNRESVVITGDDEEGGNSSPYSSQDESGSSGSMDSSGYARHGSRNAVTAPMPERLFPVRLYPSYYQD